MTTTVHPFWLSCLRINFFYQKSEKEKETNSVPSDHFGLRYDICSLSHFLN